MQCIPRTNTWTQCPRLNWGCTVGHVDPCDSRFGAHQNCMACRTARCARACDSHVNSHAKQLSIGALPPGSSCGAKAGGYAAPEVPNQWLDRGRDHFAAVTRVFPLKLGEDGIRTQVCRLLMCMLDAQLIRLHMRLLLTLPQCLQLWLLCWPYRSCCCFPEPPCCSPTLAV